MGLLNMFRSRSLFLSKQRVECGIQLPRSICLILTAFLIVLAPVEAQTLTGLGDLPGDDFDSEAMAISGDGLVVTGQSEGSILDDAFRWTEQTGMTSLGELPPILSAIGNGASVDGSAITGTLVASSVDTQAFRWTTDGLYELIGDPGGSFASKGLAISGDGLVVVGVSSTMNVDEAFRWTAADGIQGLGDLSGGSFESSANGVSADGAVIVGYSTSNSGDEAFRWTDGTGMIGIGGLFPDGSGISEANGVSADGLVIVGGSESPVGPQAFRWTAESGMVGLGMLNNNGPSEGFSEFTEALASSADGSVIAGRGYSFAIGLQAFVWTEANGLKALADVLTDFGVGVDDWQLEKATGVSNDGRRITGEGEHAISEDESVLEAFLVDLRDLDLPWTSNSSGNWDDLSNWFGQYFFPGETDHAIIDPTFPLNVNGPSDPVTIGQLTVGSVSSVSTTLTIQPSGDLTVNGLAEIRDSSRLAGTGIFSTDDLMNSGEIDLGESELRITGGQIDNFGLIQGSGQIDNEIVNQESGQIRIESSLLLPSRVVNCGQIFLLDGILDTGMDLRNQPNGFISVRGAMFIEDGIENEGVIAFTGGFSDVFGDVFNAGSGILINAAGGSVAFFDDVTHNGVEIQTSATSITTFFGDCTGAGPFTGQGDVFMEGDLQSGSNIAVVVFEGNLNLGSLANTEIKIRGIGAGSGHDQLLIDGNVSIAGSLSVVEINGLDIGPGQQFDIFEVDGLSTGTFAGLAEGDVVGNFSGMDLFITYIGGDGNDVVLFTEDTVVLLGDVNLDGVISLLDVAPFVDLLVTGMYQAEADINLDGDVNLLDVGPFVMLLTGG